MRARQLVLNAEDKCTKHPCAVGDHHIPDAISVTARLVLPTPIQRFYSVQKFGMFLARIARFSFVPIFLIQAIGAVREIVAYQSNPQELIGSEVIGCLRDQNVQPFEHPLLKQYGIVVLSGVKGAAAQTALELCSGGKTKWLEVPIVQNQRAKEVPTNEVIIKFKDHSSALAIEKLRQKYGFLIVQSPTRRNPDRYTVSLKGAAARISVSVAAEIGKVEGVQYAEVNFVVVAYPP